MPFRGTELRKLAVENMFMPDYEYLDVEDCEDYSVLNMPRPYLNADEIKKFVLEFNKLLKM
jgi:hypothetical protein